MKLIIRPLLKFVQTGPFLWNKKMRFIS